MSAIGPQLGRLEPVDRRDVWAHEAHDFTPWLLANAEVLGQVLSMDLELTRAEHPVGGYALDLIGEDVATGEVVIVENQLETSDHTHLGQILTYAGGTEPTNIVWVATSFREEHRAALEWLNARTDERTRFFAVTLSAVRIGDSLPAPLLGLVVQPNDWGKRIRALVRPDASPRATSYQAFWGRFLERVQARHPDWTNSRRPPLDNWITLPTGRSGVLLGVSLGRRGLCSELNLGHTDAELNAAWFARLEARKTDLEAAYGSPLSWEPLPDRKSAKIADYHDGSIDQTHAWDTYIDWFFDSLIRWRHAIDHLGGLDAALGGPSHADET